MQRLSAGEQVMAGLAGNPASAFAPPTHTDALAAHAATALYQQQQQMIPTGAPLFRPAAALAASEAMDMNDPAAAAMGMVLSSEAPITAGTGEGAERASAPGVRQFGSRKEYNPEKKPRRVQTAFNYFTSGERRRLRTLKPGITEEEVKEQLAVLWSLMTPEKLEHYQMCQARDQARWESQTQLHEEWLALHPKPEPPPKPKPPPKLLDAVAGDAGDTGDAGDVVDDAGTTTAAAPAASGAPKKRRNPKPLVLFKLEGVTPASGEFVKVGIQRRRPPPKPLNPEATAKEDGAEAPAAEGGASSSSARKIKATGVSKLAKARSPFQIFLGERQRELKALLAARAAVIADAQAAGLEPSPAEEGPFLEGTTWFVPVDMDAEAAQRPGCFMSALSSVWKVISSEERERYEKRSAEEKVLMAKDLAASNKRMLSGGGLGAYWKVREQIESFANRSPHAFVQLMERIAIEEKVVHSRAAKMAEKERNRIERERAAQLKARYPIADHLLAGEPPPDMPLSEWPEPRYGVNLPPHLQPLAGTLLAVHNFLVSFGPTLALSPILLEDLRAALLHRHPSALTTEIHLALLPPLLVDLVDEKCVLDRPDGRNLELGSPLALGASHISDVPVCGEETWSEVLRWLALAAVRGDAELAASGGGSTEDVALRDAVTQLRSREYSQLALPAKLSLLSWLCDAVLSTATMRETLQKNYDLRTEANAAKRKLQHVNKKARKRAAAEAAADDAEGAGEGNGADGAEPDEQPAPSAVQGKEEAFDPPPEDELDYGDDLEEAIEAEAAVEKAGSRGAQRQRAKHTADKFRKLQELKSKREAAFAALSEARTAAELPQLEDAIKLAEGARMQGARKGRKWRFPELTDALDKATELREIQEAAEEDRACRAALALAPVRMEALGVDRENRRYWRTTELGKLYVEIPPPRAPASRKRKANSPAKPPRPTLPPPSSWRFYRSRPEVEQLIDSLDERGIKERALQTVLRSHLPEIAPQLLDESPPPPPGREWLTEGPHIGKRLLLHFAEAGDSEAVVTHYLPAAGDDQALWHVRHDDGDEEDLEEEEMLAAVAHRDGLPADGLQSNMDAPFVQWNNALRQKSRRASAAALIGVDALKSRILSLVATLADAEALPFAHDGGGEDALRQEVEGAQGVPACARVVQRLEAALHVDLGGDDATVAAEDRMDVDAAHRPHSQIGGLWNEDAQRREWVAYLVPCLAEESTACSRATVALATLTEQFLTRWPRSTAKGSKKKSKPGRDSDRDFRES